MPPCTLAMQFSEASSAGAFGSGGGRDYGLASALSILIFIIVAIIAAISFRSTKSLEDLH